MIQSLARAIGQLPDPRFRRLLVKSVGVTVLFYVLLYLAVGWGLQQMALFGITWIDRLTDLLGGVAALVLTLLLFPGVVTLVLSFLLDEVAEAVEARYYPGLAPPRRQSTGDQVIGALRFSLATVAVNLVALPFYLLLLFVGIGPAVYLLVNAYLLSRDYFETAAWRRLTPGEAAALRRAHGGRLMAGGLVIALLSSVPLVNLLAPLIAAAAMVHEVQALTARSRA
ncbi:MAG TPA: hypothetical protein HPQ04_12905 [Rhodospirillaceae bacterium]|nr:hypothetical protein [Rhodospirillaceae bacterium]